MARKENVMKQITESPDGFLSEAERDGYHAAENGIALVDNPHKSEQGREDWKIGWLSFPTALRKAAS